MSKLKIYLLILFATIVAYFGSLNYGFSQDDWYFLYISTAHNLGDVLNFFNPWTQSGFAFYRPLGTQLYYYLSRLFFGLSNAPYTMHVFMLIIQSVSAYNVYILVQKLTRDNQLSILSALIYATSSVHFLSLYYIAATQQILATMFSLMAINDFLDHRTLRSAFWFLLGLLSKEVAIVAPMIAILVEVKINPKVNIKNLFPRLLGFGVIGAIYVFFRLFSGVHVQSEYGMVLNGSVISNLRWYYLFGYGAPEELVRYGLPRMGINLVSFLKDYPLQGIITSVVPIIIGVYAFIRGWRKWIYLVWWLIALGPVVFLQNHRYPHYVDLALIPMILILLENNSRRTQLIIAATLISISLTSINLSQSSHWTVKRAIMSDSAKDVMQVHGYCGYPIWYISGANDSPRELSYTLSLENGPKVICNNPDLQVYYQGVSKGDLPQNSQIISTEEIEGL